MDVRERNVSNLYILIAPFVEELRGPDFLNHILRKD